MKEIISRIFSDTPKFFKRLRAWGLSATATGVAIVAIPNVPEAVVAIGSKMIWIGAIVAAVAQMTCQDPNDVPPPTKKDGNS